MTSAAVMTLPFRPNLWISARLLPLLVVGRSLGQILAMATPDKSELTYPGLPAGEIVKAVKRVAARPWLMRDRRCLREGLLAFRFLRLAGHRPVLHFGVAPATLGEKRPRAHCWVSLDGDIILNPSTEPMVELFSHDGPGAAPGAEDINLNDVTDG